MSDLDIPYSAALPQEQRIPHYQCTHKYVIVLCIMYGLFGVHMPRLHPATQTQCLQGNDSVSITTYMASAHKHAVINHDFCPVDMHKSAK